MDKVEEYINVNEIDKKTGVLELNIPIPEVIKALMKAHKEGRKLCVELVENSKHHKGLDFIHIYEDSRDDEGNKDVSINHLEISELGTFAYQIDDGVS